MPFFGQELFQQAEKKGPLTRPAYRKAWRTAGAGAPKDRRRDDTHRLDAIVAPTGARRGPPIWSTATTSSAAAHAAAVAGYPHITVPAGPCPACPWASRSSARLVRSDADPARLRLRAGHAPSPSAEVASISRTAGALEF